MRKRKTLILVMAFFLLAALALPALAQQEKVDVYQNQKLVKSVVFAVGLNEYFVNNQTPGTKMDVAPFIESGRTFVPVRFLSNALGVQNDNIGWDGKTQLVTLKQPGFPAVEMTVGKIEVKSNGQPLAGVDVAPLLRDSRTFLPARWVAEALGYQVEWDEKTRTVICWPKGEPKPDVSAVLQYIEQRKAQVAARTLTEEDIKRLQSYPMFDGSESLQGEVNTDSFRSFEQMQADPYLREDAELVVKHDTLDALLNMRETHIGTIGTHGYKVLPSLKEYDGAEMKWLTDPRLVYRTALFQRGIRGVLLVTFPDSNKFGLTPGRTYEQDVEFRVINSLDWGTGEFTKKLEQIVLLSDFRPVRG
ncbi:copper amine oxidase N-terminal domain-containing protein [Desulfofundulus thermobenzoicus]|uniref:Copper amine oxidase N-terminal domain-containing protein n=1 Tax=Desulfofundulus thermobenzoicus TaxID=29376 RepID=A0A6N7IP95_9FIRM|nr:copper amine oxidase N-terminal domain-containing protein [Desulfofundulus thermobenzoicus]MQL51855.1 copper amine oxidase N-terminal domain-containing protein [Desulfofundulus thermobenzoicus]